MFGQNLRLEPLDTEKRALWKIEMNCLLSVCDYIVEFIPICQNLSNGDTVEMVTTFGMSEIGPWSLIDSSAQSDVIMRMMARNSMSERLAEDIDSAIKKLSDSAYEIALGHIRNNREAVDKLVEVLLEKETIGGDEFRAILSEFTEIPMRKRVPASTTSTTTPTPA